MTSLTVIFLWIPAHINVKGNEMADKMTKHATKSNNISVSKPHQENDQAEIDREMGKAPGRREKRTLVSQVQRRVGEMRCTGRTRTDETVTDLTLTLTLTLTL